MRNRCARVLASTLLLALASCAVGPGTPLVDALKTDPGPRNTNVPAPKGYGPIVNTGEPRGLINPEDRKQTEAYLESLAGE
ncbi:hypothetical protein K1718_16875 [Roseibium porphyridii]|uniref:Uncharacterized protein n=1 Tax=Roseibium porphyridii TaxID=2866279 RepID=A0ABY8F3C1_9HYPH|nr:hypothetical protein [Roseibium sp. KMA01]WFE87830.1 hypothetical protein K1718_16875 [Roseibium sp. KMA01]